VRYSAPLVVLVLILAALVGVGVPLRSGNPTGFPRPEAQHAAMLPADRGAPVRYVALGDSTVYGVGASIPENNYVLRLYTHLRSVYPHADVTNLAVSGATSADVVANQLPRAIALHPDLVTLSVGLNDLVQRKDVQEYEGNIGIIFETLRRETGAIVVVSLLPDTVALPFFRGAESIVGPQTILFNWALERKSRAQDVELVDLYATTQREVPDRPELLAADRYHPSDEGYARWAELMWGGVKTRIEPSPPTGQPWWQRLEQWMSG
jgi:acyl-CoA thioesterase I